MDSLLNTTGRSIRLGLVLLLAGLLAAAAWASHAQLARAATPGTWSPTGPMHFPRQRHTATLLLDGQVLVAGGVNCCGHVLPAELYDPAQGTWSVTGTMNVGRQFATATLLPSGKVLVTGGLTDTGVTTTAELYDPAQRTWRHTGAMGVARFNHQAVLLPDGTVLAIGGQNSGYVAAVERYDPADERWRVIGSLNIARGWLTATLLQNTNTLLDGQVLVAGGDTVFGVSATAELFDPVTGLASPAGTMGSERAVHTATSLPDGKVLVAGGMFAFGLGPGGATNQAELYDPATRAWKPVGGMNRSRSGHVATLLPNGMVMVVGGLGGGTFTELYDPAEETWRLTGSLSQSQGELTATLLADGTVLAAGGASPAERYTPGVSAAALSPASLDFGDQPVGATSAAQAITLANNGSAPLLIANFTVTGDFAQTNTCGQSLAIGASCQFDVTFTPTSAGSRAGTLTITSNAPGSPHSVALSGTGITVGKLDQTIAFDPLADQTYGAAPFAVSAAASSGLPVSFAAAGNCTISSTTVTITGAGSCTVTASQAGDSAYNAAPDVARTFTINPAPLTVTANDRTKQYSDPLPALTAGYAGFVLGEGPDVLTGALSCATTATATSAPGVYPITCAGQTATNYAITYNAGALTVVPEDARATYTGALFASTASATSGAASVTLSATIQDITAVAGDPAYDAYPGDIRNATVTFVNHDSGATLCAAPVGLVGAADSKTGTATCTWTANLSSADSASYTVRVVVGGYYRNTTQRDGSHVSVVTVSKPLATNFITGGGYLINQSSAGQYAGQAGLKSNFGFNVKYNKSGTNLQGNVNIIVRSGGRVYQIKGTAISSLAVTGSQATFSGKANIQDITDPLNPVAIDGNATLQLTLTDNGEAGSGDTLGVTAWNKAGGLWFASNWTGTRTVEQALGGGNLVVR